MITWAKVKLVTACVVAAGRRKTTATPAAAIAVAVGVWLCGAWTLQAVAEEAAGVVEVRAKSCSREDIQSAATEVKAAGGGVVRIPEGRADHGREPVRMPDGVSLIGAGRDKTVLENARIGVNTRFYGKLDKPFRISGLHLAGSSSLSIDSCHDFRIDHCTFENTGAAAVSITLSRSGLIDHCRIKVKGPYYGIIMTGSWDPKYWPNDVGTLLGKPTAIIIEDCEFEGGKSYHATAGHGAIHYVVRHSRLRGARCSLIDAHGPGWGHPRGTRCVEVYENELTCEGTGAGIRGGGGVFFGNTITNAKVGITLVLESRSKGAYPVPDQVRQVWVWDNVYTNVLTRLKVASWGGTKGMDPGEYIKENRDYFLRKPSRKEDGFEYVPYTYPHPLVREKRGEIKNEKRRTIGKRARLQGSPEPAKNAEAPKTATGKEIDADAEKVLVLADFEDESEIKNFDKKDSEKWDKTRPGRTRVLWLGVLGNIWTAGKLELYAAAAKVEDKRRVK